MDMKPLKLAPLALALAFAACQTPPPAPCGPTPSPAQVAWQQMEYNLFVHFGPNTFSGAEWGNGKESVDLFAPSALDCNQWAAIARAAGMKGVIITAKHHDGFCLWPNPESRHTVAQSAWRDGKGDILRELSDACREQGVKFGVYISPWDCNDPTYGTDAYNAVFERTLESALDGTYGEVFEQWFDGACGEGPNGKRQVYDWERYHRTVYNHQPDAVIFSDVGPGCRWVGNESGSAGRTCWSRLDTVGFSPGLSPARDTLNCGNVHGKAWIPAETDVSIRPGWFYRDSENEAVKSLADLLSIYYNSVGRNSLLLLNVPPDTRGLIHPIDSMRLMELRAALDAIFGEDLAAGASVEASNVRGRGYGAKNLLSEEYNRYWATEDGVNEAVITLKLKGEKSFNRVMLQEYIPLGQRVEAFRIEVLDSEGAWREVAAETTIGYKRIVRIDRVTTSGVRITIDRAQASPVLNRVALYDDRIFIEAPVAQRDKEGMVTLTAAEGEIHYTTDGSRPTAASPRYTEPFAHPGACHLMTLAVSGERRSEVGHYRWDIAPRDFSALTPAGAAGAVDGLSDAGDEAVSQGAVIAASEPLVVDLGGLLSVDGFAYEPLAKGREGVLIDYDFAVSRDGKRWTTLLEGASFDNIVNNPIRRTEYFAPTEARYVRLTPRRTQLADRYGIAELGILTARR